MTVRFAVRVSVPVYHHSTDGYVGHQVLTHNIFPNIADAVDYAWLENAEAIACGDTDVAFFVCHRRAGQWIPTDLTPYAPNTALADPWDLNSAPF